MGDERFDLVQRLRPYFMRTSGPTNWSIAAQSAIVRVNDQDMVTLALRQIQPSFVQEMRSYSATDATAKVGGIRGRPVIAVIARKGTE